MNVSKIGWYIRLLARTTPRFTAQKTRRREGEEEQELEREEN